MEQNEYTYIPTTFDVETQSKDLQILKTLIPYIKSPGQKNFALLVKCMEIKNVLSVFQKPHSSIHMCAPEDPSEMRLQLLNDIKKFCSPAEQDSIDMMLMAFQMFSSYDTMFASPLSE